MRRLALFATALAVACSSDKDEGDRTPPAPPVVSAPAQGAELDATDLDGDGHLVVAGTAEAGATIQIRIDGALAATAAAAADGAWSFAATLASGPHGVSAVAIDAAGNASAPSAAVSFTLDLTRLASPLPPGSPPPVTSWGQSVPVTPIDASGLGELFPGEANSWALGPDFSLAQGFGLEYSNALALYVGIPTGYAGAPAELAHDDLLSDVADAAVNLGPLDAFPGATPLTASEAVFLTPLFGAADGVVTALASDGAGAWVPPPISGSLSGYLNGTSDSRLSRALTLAGGTYTFGWKHEADLFAGNLAGAPTPSYQVVLRDPATGAAIGAPLFSSSTNVSPGTPSVTRSELPAQVVVLSFELRSAVPGYAQIDDLTLDDGAGRVTLANPGFEEGLAPWQASAGAESQNVRSGARDVGTAGSGLRITRTFYAPPAATWGRMVDVFENTGTSDVATVAVYLTTLGGDAPLSSVTQGGAAVVGWDAAASVRDVGIVAGTGTGIVDATSPFVFVVHALDVPAGGKVALAHFVVQLGEAGGGATVAAVPAGTDLECGAIAAGFPALEEYRLDLEPGVLDLVTNF
jgi:hypothetical protein